MVRVVASWWIIIDDKYCFHIYQNISKFSPQQKVDCTGAFVWYCWFMMIYIVYKIIKICWSIYNLTATKGWMYWSTWSMLLIAKQRDLDTRNFPLLFWISMKKLGYNIFSVVIFIIVVVITKSHNFHLKAIISIWQTYIKPTCSLLTRSTILSA